MELILHGCLALVAANFVLCGARAVRGPTAFDRVVALDALTLNFLGGVVVLSLLLRTAVFLDVLLATALVGFVVPAVLAAYLESARSEARRG